MQAQAAAARSVALLDRPLQALEACRTVFLARLPRAAAYDAWWHVRVPPSAAPQLSSDLPDWRCGLMPALLCRACSPTLPVAWCMVNALRPGALLLVGTQLCVAEASDGRCPTGRPG